MLAERDPAARERRREEMNEVLSKAARLAKPEDPDSVDILLTHARVLAQQGITAQNWWALTTLKFNAYNKIETDLANTAEQGQIVSFHRFGRIPPRW